MRQRRRPRRTDDLLDRLRVFYAEGDVSEVERTLVGFDGSLRVRRRGELVVAEGAQLVDPVVVHHA